MKKMRILSFLMAVMTVVSCISFASCGDGDDNDKPKETTQLVDDELFPDYIPADLDFGGNEITFLVMGEGVNNADWRSQDIFAESDSDDPIVSAVFRRNAFLESKYNCKIKEVPTDTPGTTARNSIKSGLDEFQVLMCNTAATITLMQDELLVDLNNLDYLDLTQPWWDQTMRKNCSIAGSNYFATGDISIMDNDATWIMMFNKQLAAQYDLDPYKEVENNTWTYDKLFEMMQLVAHDDGDGVVEWDSDTFGMSTHNSTCEALFYACGKTIVSKDEADLPYFVQSSSYVEYITRVLEKSIEFWCDESLVFSSDRSGLTSVETQQVFESGRSLFLAEVLQLAIRLRTMDINFGIIPFPKFESSQKNYGHFVHSTTALLSIPYTCKNVENVAAFVEAMAAKSMYTLTPAYYDIALTGKSLRDEESSEMLDIILASRTFDLGGYHMFNWGGMGDKFSSLLKDGDNSFATIYKRSIKKATSYLQDDIDKIADNQIS